MITPRTSLTLAFCLIALGLAGAGCKKASTTTPDGDSPGGDAAADASDGGGGGGGGYDGPQEDVLTVDSFEETMQNKQGDVADCFAQAKESKPDLAGKLALDVTVAGDGSRRQRDDAALRAQPVMSGAGRRARERSSYL
jgi:hypothetical protein